jgi:Putative DNA-binding domain
MPGSSNLNATERADTDFQRALEAIRESRRVDFKVTFDPARLGDWCEVVKDIVALANSGGGCLVFGVKDDGKPAGTDVGSILGIDPALITDKIAKYTGVQFDGFEMREGTRSGNRIAVLVVKGIHTPMPFSKAGGYDRGDGKQLVAFQPGTVYFRHGAKSEPGTFDDIRRSLDRAVDERRRSWLGGIKKVVSAPRGHRIEVISPTASIVDSPPATGVRLTIDPRAPTVRSLNPDDTHPFRLKEATIELNKRLDGRAKVSSYGIQCVRKTHSIDDGSHPEFFYEPKFGSPQYSREFVEWMVKQYESDSTFFQKAWDGKKV